MVLPLVRRAIKSITALAIAFGMSGVVNAADVAMPTKAPIAPAPAIQGWTYSFTPYVWATSLTGSRISWSTSWM